MLVFCIIFTVLYSQLLRANAIFHPRIPKIPIRESDTVADIAELAVWETLGLTDMEYVNDDTFLSVEKPNYEADVRFRLYTRNDYSVGTDVQPDPKSLLASSINPKIPTKIFIYGFTEELKSASVHMLKESYLGYAEYNLIVVDWQWLASFPNYVAARFHTAGVANRTAQLLNGLAESNLCPPNKQHIIGHSLGAQIAGMAGSAARIKPGRITGLDPAGPLFELAQDEGRIDYRDADLVDIIHTSAAMWGLPAPLGHVDFYPNGGVWPQTDCTDDSYVGVICSHCRAVHFFAYSINHPEAYIGTRCQTHSVIRGICPNSTETAVMGEHVSFDVPGVYYLNATFPDGILWQTC